MMKAAVVIDDWKLGIFEKELIKSGFEYKIFNGPTKGCITLSVLTKSAAKLQPAIERAQKLARRSKKH